MERADNRRTGCCVSQSRPTGSRKPQTGNSPPRTRHPAPGTSQEDTLLETRDGRPSRVRIRGRWLPVLDVVDAWVIQGRWWSQEERRLYTRLRTHAGTFDLCYRMGRWHLEGAVD